MTSFAVPPELLWPDELDVDDDDDPPLLDPELVSPPGGRVVVDSAQPNAATLASVKSQSPPKKPRSRCMSVPPLQGDPTDEPEFPKIRTGERRLSNIARDLLGHRKMRLEGSREAISQRTGDIDERIRVRPFNITIPIRSTKPNHQLIDRFNSEKRVE